MTNYYNVLMTSRNKDNKELPGFKQRTWSFLVPENYNRFELNDTFDKFIAEGVRGEVSRAYISVNLRDGAKVHQALMHDLIDQPDMDLTKIAHRLTQLATAKTSRTHHWLLDVDTHSHHLLQEIVAYLQELFAQTNMDNTFILKKSLSGYHIIVDHGFDTRELLAKFPEIDLKRDAMTLLKVHIPK